MELYPNLSSKEIKAKLKEYGYRNLSTLDKATLDNTLFVAEKDNNLIMKYKASPIDYTKFGMSRCNAVRRQRFVYDEDLKLIKSSIPEFASYDIEEYIWVSVYDKENVRYYNVFLKTKSDVGYVFMEASQNIYNGKIIKLNVSQDKDYKNIVNKVMTNEQYYWYRQSTELINQLSMKRNVNIRLSRNHNTNELIYIMFKLSKNKTRIMKLNNKDLTFDYMNNLKEFYWTHIHLESDEKSYIIYKTNENVYTLIKFRFNISKVADVITSELKMVKVFLSDNYDDIINKGLIHKEYELYMNETN
jgi:hypothetical protein